MRPSVLSAATRTCKRASTAPTRSRLARRSASGDRVILLERYDYPDIEQDSLVWLKAHLSRLRNSTTTETRYDRAVAVFERRPQRPGRVLDWVCRGDVSMPDLSADRLELRPA